MARPQGESGAGKTFKPGPVDCTAGAFREPVALGNCGNAWIVPHWNGFYEDIIAKKMFQLLSLL